MLFKNGLAQSARWNLDDFEGDDPNTKVETFCLVPSDIASVLTAAERVIFVHYKLAGVLGSAPKQLLGIIETNLTVKTKAPEFKGLDGYDMPGEVDEHRILKEVPVYRVKSHIVVVVPAIDVEVCGKFAKTVLNYTKTIQVYTPGQGFGQPVTVVRTSAAAASRQQLPDLASAVPPAIIQGATAALMSAAQRLEIDATAILVYADGTAGHEIMLAAHQQQAHDILFNELGLEKGPSSHEISALYL